jgi:thiol-disulfide isomerase/thioredoxin
MNRIFGNRSFLPALALLTSLTIIGANRAQSAPAPLKLNQSLKDLSGTARPLPNKVSKATVLVFVAKDCPISNMYAPEISRIANDYSKRGVQLMVVYAEGDLTPAKARAHAKEYGFKVPLLIDSKHTLSNSVGATVTPEAVVVGPDGRRLYMGRIDNRHAAFGKTRKQVNERDLRVALDAVLAGKAVPKPVTTAIGCFIPEPTQ